MNLFENDIIHLPDLLLVKWCEENFGVNRGVYNTIDSWFYEKGIRDVTQRRQYILHFFEYEIQYRGKSEKLKFGHGQLSTCLHSFWENVSCLTHKIHSS